MIKVIVPENEKFHYDECKNLYLECQDKLRDVNFDDVIRKTWFYAFHIAKTGELLGCIYYYMKGDKLYVNAFSTRGHHLINIECFRESLKWWDCDVYAEATEPTSRLCCIRCGFEKIKDNLYVYRR